MPRAVATSKGAINSAMCDTEGCQEFLGRIIQEEARELNLLRKMGCEQF